MAKPDWITVTPTSGSNNGSFDVIAAKNTGVARNGIITVAGGGEVKLVILFKKVVKLFSL